MTAQEARELTLKARAETNKVYIDQIETQIWKSIGAGKDVASFELSGVPAAVIQKFKADGFIVNQVFDRNEEVITISWPPEPPAPPQRKLPQYE